MRSYHALITIVVLLLTPFASADITGWNCDDDGDGAIVMNTPTWTAVPGEEGQYQYFLTMSGTQYSYPAHVEGDFATGDQDLKVLPAHPGLGTRQYRGKIDGGWGMRNWESRERHRLSSGGS